jgi:hypothetical protein
MRDALLTALRILARDGIRPLEGLAYTQDERERIERAAGCTVAELLAPVPAGWASVGTDHD